ncbi:hypothetical protein ACIVBQ_000373 [Tenacibaculum discolor]
MLEDKEYNREFFKIFNDKHNTDFELMKFEYDEVVFAVIKTENCGDNEILQLGIELTQYSRLKSITN